MLHSRIQNGYSGGAYRKATAPCATTFQCCYRNFFYKSVADIVLQMLRQCDQLMTLWGIACQGGLPTVMAASLPYKVVNKGVNQSATHARN